MPHGMHALNAHARMYYGNSVRLNKTKIGYEPAGLTVHPPPPERSRVGSFFFVWVSSATKMFS